MMAESANDHSNASMDGLAYQISVALREAVVRHAAAGFPISAIENGQVVWIDAANALQLMEQQGQDLPKPIASALRSSP